jgi:hypothetical protein
LDETQGILKDTRRNLERNWKDIERILRELWTNRTGFWKNLAGFFNRKKSKKYFYIHTVFYLFLFWAFFLVLIYFFMKLIFSNTLPNFCYERFLKEIFHPDSANSNSWPLKPKPWTYPLRYRYLKLYKYQMAKRHI